MRRDAFWSRLWESIRRDRAARAYLLAVCLLGAPLLVSGSRTSGVVEVYARSWIGLLSSGLAAVVVGWRARGAEDAQERLFWSWVTAALGLLAFGGVCLELSYRYFETSLWSVATDASYVAFYLSLVVACQTAPGTAGHSRGRLAWFEIAALAGSVLWLLVYFTFIPLHFDPADYESALPSMYLYLVLDIALTLLFVRLTRRAADERWRTAYALGAAAMASWALLDLSESLGYAEVISFVEAGPLDLAWLTPTVLLVLAQAVRRLPAEAFDSPTLVARHEVGHSHGTALLAAVALPAVHLAFEALAVWGPELSRPRQVVVLGGALILGGLALAERREIQRKRRLEGERRARAEEALRESEARYRRLVETAPDAIVVIDAVSGRFVDCNERALSLFGLPRERLLDLGPLDLSPPVQPCGDESARIGPEKVARALEGETLTFAWVHRDAEGRDFECEVHLAPHSSEGRPQVRGSIVDVSEEVALRQRLRDAQRMESVGRLAGGVAHDFNNLLTVIIGYADSVGDDSRLPPDLARDLGEVRTASRRAASLTGQLLAFSRRQMLRPRPVDLNDIVRRSHGMLERLIGEDLRLELRLDPGVPQVVADPGQVEQVVLNLAANARDAMPAGGVLTLETTTWVETGEDPEGTEAVFGRLSVIDTGHGMDAETRAKIFEPFYTTKGLGRGTGLGLATVYGIVMQSGGRLSVTSEPGQGARFDVGFPAHAAGPVEQQPAGRPASASGKEVVLLVEDEEAVRDLTKRGLEALGYRVTGVGDAREAFRAARRLGRGIDVVVSDVVLPGASGPEIVETLRRERPSLPVIYVSGYTDDLIAKKGALDDRTPFIQKPFTARRLAQAIRQVIDRPRAFEASA